MKKHPHRIHGKHRQKTEVEKKFGLVLYTSILLKDNIARCREKMTEEQFKVILKEF